MPPVPPNRKSPATARIFRLFSVCPYMHTSFSVFYAVYFSTPGKWLSIISIFISSLPLFHPFSPSAFHKLLKFLQFLFATDANCDIMCGLTKKGGIFMSIHDKVSMIFCSCDAYSDMWQNFFFLLKKYWPEFDGEIILNTESQTFQYDGYSISEPLCCAKDTSWSERLSRSLDRAKNPYVLVLIY